MVQRFRTIAYLLLILSIGIANNSYASFIIDTRPQTTPIQTIYTTKDDLFNSFFRDFYNYIVEYRGDKQYLESNGVYTLDQFYFYAKAYNEYESQGMPWIGNLVGTYFARPDRIHNLQLQTPEDGFIGYCLYNNMYVPQINFFITWFYNLRKDEGMLDKYGAKAVDFLDYPHDSIIDVCKLFYWTRDTIPYFLQSKGYIENYLENIPGVLNY